ncbi:MAG: hypothetical protein M1820_001951 [Bogoriella megaspora]|nr:MAG: hypothetical protein M1820_001951 [Bogoriella megaspora]
MPKNPHPPRGPTKGKKPASAPQDGEDTSFIVFSNAKGEPKKSKKSENSPQPESSNKVKKQGKESQPTSSTDDASKKPDTRTLIGGSSWTGKLPVNMLSEHCQKQKWHKPEYTMERNSGGFVSSVILRKDDPKAREVISLPPIRLPPSLKDLATQPSAVEARHFAAAYTLFRICNMRNIHMMLPPNYRDLWKGKFTDFKKEDQDAGRGWMYEADPFLAQKEQEEARALVQKRRDEAQKRREQETQQPGVAGKDLKDSGSSTGSILRGWTNIPKVEMGRQTRNHVEGLVRNHGSWNLNRTHLSVSNKSKLTDEVAALGFRHAHVEEALEICKDREETLEWLLIHVPEDDLPKWALAENYVAGVSMASGDLKRESKLRRLNAAGYSFELCEEALDRYRGDELLAAQALQAGLLHMPITIEPGHTRDVSSTNTGAETFEDIEPWQEEQDVLKSIFGDRYTLLDDSNGRRGCQISLQIVQLPGTTLSLQAFKPPTGYPLELPIIFVLSDMPAYIRLSMAKRALLQAQENFIGEQMLYNIVDWLEQEIPNIIETPEKLSDIIPTTLTGSDGQGPHSQSLSDQRQRKSKPIDWTLGSKTSVALREQWNAKQSLPTQQQMMKPRQALPAWKMQEAIVNAVQNYQVTIISGETGSGKSTQSVQFILDDMIQHLIGSAANIICTQPRRISALGLADRVANERCSKVGDEVGYSIRGESRITPGTTRITFVTTGVLLRRLQTSGGHTNDVLHALADVSHVVVDEVHERSLDTDFLLILLRDVLSKRKDLKVILMSATLDAAIFENYFNQAASVAKVSIEGRTFPVEDYYLDDVVRMTGFNSYVDDAELQNDQVSMSDALRNVGMKINYDLIAKTVIAIDRDLAGIDGAILIFLPGTAEIDRTLRLLKGNSNILGLPLHASLQPSEQRQVFPRAPKGKRKVIASTNVAETSITIEDVVAVIDTGRVRETRYDAERNMVILEEVWASRAACKQRRGRAGRVQAGNCYKLYTQSAEQNRMAERPEPEIKRVPLEQLCLSVKAMGIDDVPSFLASAITPPSNLAVESALDLLSAMRALDGRELTSLGRHLAMIPADLRCGKLLVYGAIFGCLEACLTIAAVLTVRSPFVSPQAKREESKAARSSFGKGHGDLISDLRAYDKWTSKRDQMPSRAQRGWCDENFLSSQTLFDIANNRSQYLSFLKDVGFLPITYHGSNVTTMKAYNRQHNNDALIRALIAGAFNPQIARIQFPNKKFAASSSGAVALDPEARSIKYFNQDNGRVFVHPSSTLFEAQSFPGSSIFMSYFSKMETSKTFIRELTPFNVYSLLFFSGAIELDTLGRGLVVDGWVRLRGWARIGVLVSRMRMMLDELLAKKIDEPSLDVGMSEVVQLVTRMIELDGMDQ